jgi:hypothetical protein
MPVFILTIMFDTGIEQENSVIMEPGELSYGLLYDNGFKLQVRDVWCA